MSRGSRALRMTSRGPARPNRIIRTKPKPCLRLHSSQGRDSSRIVLLQDHPLMAIGTHTFLSRAPGLEVCGSFADPATAMVEMPEPLPDLAVYELNVIGPYDLRFLQRLRRAFPALPVLVYSFHEEVFFAHRAFEAGANGFLMKNEPPDRLTIAIDTVLSGDLYRSDRLARTVSGAEPGRIPGKSCIHRLSNRELQVLQCLGEEFSERSIAQRLGIRSSTVQGHIRAIVKKFGLRDKAELFDCARHWVYFESQFV